MSVTPAGSRPTTTSPSPSRGRPLAHSDPCVRSELRLGHETVQAHQLGKLCSEPQTSVCSCEQEGLDWGSQMCCPGMGDYPSGQSLSREGRQHQTLQPEEGRNGGGVETGLDSDPQAESHCEWPPSSLSVIFPVKPQFSELSLTPSLVQVSLKTGHSLKCRRNSSVPQHMPGQ